MNDKKWEYKSVPAKTPSDDLKKFKKLGSEGWEFVGFFPYFRQINKETFFAYFKREK